MKFDYQKMLEENVGISANKPAFWFEVVVVIPKEVQEMIIKERGYKNPKVIEQVLIETAEAWAKEKVRRAYPKFWGAHSFPHAYGKRDPLKNTRFIVALVYSWG